MGSQQADEQRLAEQAVCSISDPTLGGVVATDRLLLDRLIESHHAPLYRYAFRLSGSEADAEDLVQQVFMTACRKLDQLREPESVSSWLYAVLRSCFLKSLRKPRPQSAGGLDLDTFATQTTPAREITGDELQHALGQLPAEYRVVLALFYFEHCTYKQIAEKLDLPIGTVMSRLARAKQRLRGELSGDDVETVRLASRPAEREAPALPIRSSLLEPGR